MKSAKKEITIPNIAAALRNVFDPEVGFNIVDMGLIYGLEIEEKSVKIKLTYSSPACPLGEVIEQDIRTQLNQFFGVTEIQLHIVFDPQWKPAMMSQVAKDFM
ncbi:MAG: metal-sulfur cluster assembly factor [Bacteroidota bacterium]|nr:metal-sulfur cluster assembly factor [Bacteroidota bacterium]